jgi:hypothetical protein
VLNHYLHHFCADGCYYGRVGKKGQQSLLLLNELSQDVALHGNLGNLHNEHYFHKGEHREIDVPESDFEWVIQLFNHPRHFYKMFRMSQKVFMPPLDGHLPPQSAATKLPQRLRTFPMPL